MDEPSLATMTPQEILAYSESHTDLHSWRRFDLFRLASDGFKAEGDDSSAEEMRREMLLYSFAMRQGEGRRFIPQSAGTTATGKKQEYPDIDADFPASVVDYFKRRVSETTNPGLKARYADFLWEKKEGFPYGKAAVEAYIEAAPLYYDAPDLLLELSDALDRALDLAARFRDPALIQAALDVHHDLIRRMRVDMRYRPLLELAESLISAARAKGAVIDWPQLTDALEEAIGDYVENEPENFIIRRAFMERLIDLHESQKDKAAADSVRVRRAESFVEEALAKGGPQANMLASHFYEQAMNAYSDLGGHDAEVQALQVKIQEANAAAVPEFSTISVPFEIAKAPFDERIAGIYKGQTAAAIFRRMAVDPELIPSYQSALAFAQQSMQEFPLQNMIATQVVRGTLVVRTISTEAEKLEYNAIQHFQRGYLLVAELYLNRIFDILKTDHPNFVEELERHFAASTAINSDRLAILRHGLIHYSREEWVAANHILVLQLEGILRDMLGLLGLPTWSPNRSGTGQQARMLPGILKTLEGIPGIDRDLVKFLSVLLNDQLGDNYRNDIGHALAPIGAFTKGFAELLILLLIKLSNYGGKPASPPANSPQS